MVLQHSGQNLATDGTTVNFHAYILLEHAEKIILSFLAITT